MLEIKNLHVSIGDRKILDGLTLTVHDGEVAAIMGPNGTGKSTLSYVIAGREGYEVTQGEVLLERREYSGASRRMSAPPRACFSPFNIRSKFPASRR